MKLNTFKVQGRIETFLIDKIHFKSISKILDILIRYLLFYVYFIFSFFLNKKEKNIDDNYSKRLNRNISKKVNLKSLDTFDLSILIPVYNSEKYIEECLESVLQQNTSCNYEIIIVNDGSVDKTDDILKSYSKNKKIKIINQENKGISFARNKCLQEASGKYIMFLDSDDKLEADSIDFLMKYVKDDDIDVVQGSYYKYNNKYRKEIIFNKKELIKEKDLYEMLNLPGFPWGKIIRKELFNNNGFYEGLYFEDTILPYNIFYNSKKIVVLDKIIYAYRDNQYGLTNTLNKNLKCADTLYIIDKILSDMNIQDIKNYQLYKFTLSCQLSYVTYYRIKNVELKTQKELFIYMCKIFEKFDIVLKNNESIILKNIEKSLKNKNFYLWKYTSILINFIV